VKETAQEPQEARWVEIFPGEAVSLDTAAVIKAELESPGVRIFFGLTRRHAERMALQTFQSTGIAEKDFRIVQGAYSSALDICDALAVVNNAINQPITMKDAKAHGVVCSPE